MKRLLANLTIGAAALAPFAAALPAQAALTPQWDVTGTYTWLVLGTYAHDITIDTQNPDGSFTGHGGYPAGGPYQTTETITGQVTGSSITFTTTYDGPYNAGFTANVSGTIHSDGSMSGTSPWEWHMTSGMAHLTTTLDAGQLSAAACTGKVGTPVVDIIEKVVGDVDSGLAGNYWANDHYDRHIQVWHTGNRHGTTFCAIVTYEGTADAVSGQTGPGGSGTIGTGVSADMSGGYRATFTGSIRHGDLPWKNRGTFGPVDYQCDLSGNCPGRIDWVAQYFRNASPLSLDWWGWSYDAGTHGTWLNSSDGTFGNIL